MVRLSHQEREMMNFAANCSGWQCCFGYQIWRRTIEHSVDVSYKAYSECGSLNGFRYGRAFVSERVINTLGTIEPRSPQERRG